MPRLPSSEAMSAVSSPQTNAPAPRRTSTLKLKSVPRIFSPSSPAARRLADRPLDALDGQRVFGPDVEEAGLGADGVAADQHPLQDGVRVALQDAAVHVGARVALVAVADDEVLVGLRLAGQLPLQPDREACAAPAAQAGRLQLVDHLLGRHAGQDAGQALVAAAVQVLVDFLGVDHAAVAHDDAVLASLALGRLRLAGDAGQLGDAGHASLLGQRPALGDRGDQLRGDAACDLAEHDRGLARQRDLDQGFHAAHAGAAGARQAPLQRAGGSFGGERGEDRLGSGSQAAGAHAHLDDGAIRGWGLRKSSGLEFGEGQSCHVMPSDLRRSPVCGGVPPAPRRSPWPAAPG